MMNVFYVRSLSIDTSLPSNYFEKEESKLQYRINANCPVAFGVDYHLQFNFLSMEKPTAR